MRPLTRFSYQPLRAQPNLSDDERERDILNLAEKPGLNFRARIIRGMDVCVWILRQMGYKSIQYVDQEYGSEFIEMTGHSGSLSVKLMEPSNIIHIQTVGICTVLSELVPESLVLYFIKPIKDGKPMAMPISCQGNVEKEVVRGFFFCLNSLGLKFQAKTLSDANARLKTVRQELKDSDQLVSFITTHLLSESASS